MATVEKDKPKKARGVPVREILQGLAACYPDAHCELNFTNPFELLIATMLSAQCTDKRVNIITGRLFQKYKTPADFIRLTQEQLEDEIRDCGLFKNKARNILETCRILEDQYGGQVPQTMEELVQLPGVGRKTANVVLSNAFGVPAIAVDTHVFRVANRLGLAESKTPEETEQRLMRRLPREQWSQAHHWLIWHGRRVCDARKPRCGECAVQPYCKEGKKRIEQGATGRAASLPDRER